MKTKARNRKGPEELLLAAPFLFGLYFPWTAAIAVLFLLGVLLLQYRKGELRLAASPFLLAAVSIVFFQALGALWGVDRGMAWIGTLQFLPLPLFVIALEQVKAEDRALLLRNIPSAAACMVLLSLLLSSIPAFSSWFLTDGRLSGFFQYPNTFALYLLAGIVLLLFGEYPERKRLILLVILFAGVALSRSRAVLVLLFFVLVYYTLRKGPRKKRLAAAGAAAVLLTGAVWYLTRSGTSLSTFYGRILYMQDVLPVIGEHPLGLGYLGYYWLQGSFQTGVYTNVHVHNDFLQLLADTGWIPAGLCIWAMIRSLRRAGDREPRLCLAAVICLHSLFDFDLQFPAVTFLLLTALDTEMPGKRLKKTAVIPLSAGVLAAFSLWLGTASFLQYTGNTEAATRLYPNYTTALVQRLPYTESTEQAALTERILKLNRSAAPAWDAKAQASFYEGRLKDAAEEKRTALGLRKYDQEEYVEYLKLLKDCWEISMRRGNVQDASDFLNRMAEVPDIMRETMEQTSALGTRIRDQASLRMPEEYKKWISEKRGFNSY